MARDVDGIIQEKFAGAGDVGIGDVVITEGWPLAYSTPGGKDPQRLQFNQIYRWLFALAVEVNQKGPFLDYNATINYAINAGVVGSDGRDYRAIVANGPGTSVVDPVGNPATWADRLAGQIESVKTTVITSSDTFVPDSKTVSIGFEYCGGGGGAGGVDGQGVGTVALGGCGAGAGHGKKTTNTIDTSYAIVIGAKGVGGAAGANDGTAGGNTTITSTTLTLVANGGAPGAGQTGTSGGDSVPSSAGGTATGGDVNISGEPSTRGRVGSGTFSQYPYAGNSLFNGRGISQANGGAGENATAYGCAGAGAQSAATTDNFAGGDGEQGVVIIKEYLGV